MKALTHIITAHVILQRMSIPFQSYQLIIKFSPGKDLFS